jgi:hypothetical protein
LPEPLQSAEIIRTDVTFRCCAFAIDDPPCAMVSLEVPDAVLPDVAPPDVVLPGAPLVEPVWLGSIVPVTSIRWPTCFLRSLSLPMSTYDAPMPFDAFAPDVAVPDVLVPEPLPLPDPVVPDVLPLADVPDVPAVDVPLPPEVMDPFAPAIDAFARMKVPALRELPLVEPDAVASGLPVIVARPPLPSCRHPVTVTGLPLRCVPLIRSLCVPLCAAVPATQVAVIASAVAVHV